MFTHRLRRRRHTLDTYIHSELKERTTSDQNAPVPSIRDMPDGGGAHEKPGTRARAS
jgi:hypothetical protein